MVNHMGRAMEHEEWMLILELWMFQYGYQGLQHNAAVLGR